MTALWILWLGLAGATEPLTTDEVRLGRAYVRLSQVVQAPAGMLQVEVYTRHPSPGGPAWLHRVDAVAADGTVAEAPVLIVMEEERNGGGAVTRTDDGWKLTRFQGSSHLVPVRIAITETDPLPASLRLVFDGGTVELDVAAHVTPPKPTPEATGACAELVVCCSKHSGESERACLDIATSASSLGVPEPCEDAKAAYCR